MRKLFPALVLLNLALFGLLFWLALVALPDMAWYEEYEPALAAAQRIFYIHVPVAWTMFVALSINFVASVVYLLKGGERADALALSCAETGFFFGTLAILTGTIWAKPAWGDYWLWEPRLTTMAVAWVSYGGYLLLRGAYSDPERSARVGALLSLVIFVQLPLVFMSVRIWNTVHPAVVAGGQGSGLEPPMAWTLLLGVVAVMLLFGLLTSLRYRVERARLKLLEKQTGL